MRVAVPRRAVRKGRAPRLVEACLTRAAHDELGERRGAGRWRGSRRAVAVCLRKNVGDLVVKEVVEETVRREQHDVARIDRRLEDRAVARPVAAAAAELSWALRSEGRHTDQMSS